MTNAQQPLQSSPAATANQEAGRSSTSSPLTALVERLFERLSAFYGSKFGDMWRGCDLVSVKSAWADALEGYTPQEIKRGLDECMTRVFPPTLPEFLLFCRPKLNPEAAYVEAVEQMRVRHTGGKDIWSSPVVFHAAAKIGNDIQRYRYDEIKARWHTALDTASHDIANGRLPNQVPGYRMQIGRDLPQVSRETAEANLRRIRQIIADAAKRTPW